ncbi:MAG: hypothetical protein KDA99_13550 [Planctomycetales bacterium]|nr:hypothetical protein [Planctomycetales bacterium]
MTMTMSQNQPRPTNAAPVAGKSKAKDNWYANDRLGGLRRFAIAITVLNILGHLWLGFEQAWAHPFVALAAAYGTEFILEFVDSRAQRKTPRYRGSWKTFIEFFLPAHISGMAVSMLLYPGSRLMPTAFAAVVAMASKNLLRVQQQGRVRHVLNPSNLGITVTLLLFPWVGIAPPYQFTENLLGWGDAILPAIIICSGTFLNTRYTRRLPLIAAWLTAFVLQALVRSIFFDTTLLAGLMPMTGVAFLLFTFYMVTDPPTTPSTTQGQIVFGASVAIVYGILMVSQIVFGLFFSLTIVATLRYVYLLLLNRQASQQGAGLVTGNLGSTLTALPVSKTAPTATMPTATTPTATTPTATRPPATTSASSQL